MRWPNPPPSTVQTWLSILNQDYTRAPFYLKSLAQYCLLHLIETSALVTNLNVDTFNMHLDIFCMKNIVIACSLCLNCFGECNFQTKPSTCLTSWRQAIRSNYLFMLKAEQVRVVPFRYGLGELCHIFVTDCRPNPSRHFNI